MSQIGTTEQTIQTSEFENSEDDFEATRRRSASVFFVPANTKKTAIETKPESSRKTLHKQYLDLYGLEEKVFCSDFITLSNSKKFTTDQVAKFILCILVWINKPSLKNNFELNEGINEKLRDYAHCLYDSACGNPASDKNYLVLHMINYLNESYRGKFQTLWKQCEACWNQLDASSINKVGALLKSRSTNKEIGLKEMLTDLAAKDFEENSERLFDYLLSKIVDATKAIAITLEEKILIKVLFLLNKLTTHVELTLNPSVVCKP